MIFVKGIMYFYICILIYKKTNSHYMNNLNKNTCFGLILTTPCIYAFQYNVNLLLLFFVAWCVYLKMCLNNFYWRTLPNICGAVRVSFSSNEVSEVRYKCSSLVSCVFNGFHAYSITCTITFCFCAFFSRYLLITWGMITLFCGTYIFGQSTSIAIMQLLSEI